MLAVSEKSVTPGIAWTPALRRPPLRRLHVVFDKPLPRSIVVVVVVSVMPELAVVDPPAVCEDDGPNPSPDPLVVEEESDVLVVVVCVTL